MQMTPVNVQRTQLLFHAQAPICQLCFQGCTHIARREEGLLPKLKYVLPSALVNIKKGGVPQQCGMKC